MLASISGIIWVDLLKYIYVYKQITNIYLHTWSYPFQFLEHRLQLNLDYDGGQTSFCTIGTTIFSSNFQVVHIFAIQGLLLHRAVLLEPIQVYIPNTPPASRANTAMAVTRTLSNSPIGLAYMDIEWYRHVLLTGQCAIILQPHNKHTWIIWLIWHS